MIRGAPHTRDFLKNELRNLVTSKAKVLEAWAAAGKIEPVDPVHLFSVIWAATQHYADFEVQVGALLGRRQLAADDYRSEEQTSELQSLMRISYAVFCLQNKNYNTRNCTNYHRRPRREAT